MSATREKQHGSYNSDNLKSKINLNIITDTPVASTPYIDVLHIVVVLATV